MKGNTKLTIALLTYNRASGSYMQEALEAILNQTYTDFELIVMDNHSTDNTADVVLSYHDSRLTYVRQPPYGNGTTNYTSALWMSRGEYILLTHDDDVMEPNMIEKQMAFIKNNPRVLCVGTNVSLIDEKGELIQDQMYEFGGDCIYNEVEYIRTYLEEKLWLPTPTLLFNRKAHISAIPRLVKKKKSKYQSSGDIWLLFLLNLKGQIGVLSEPLLRYRQHPGQESRTVDQSAPMANMAGNLLRSRSRNKKLKKYLPDIWGSYLRFKAQDMLFNTMRRWGREKVKEHLLRLRSRWVKNVSPELRSVDSALPFEILLREFGLEPTIEASNFQRIMSQPANVGAQKGYRHWMEALTKNRSLFEAHPEIKTIAIVGSMLTSFLIVEAARKSSVQVMCCLDSSSARIGQNVFGIPVVPHDELRKMISLDAVILSSERDHEQAISNILSANLPRKDLPIYSWKELAGEAAATNEHDSLNISELTEYITFQQICY
ncbi:MAG: glycosyltransferase [Thermodesulfobacteriota bacterium]|nr:glycosyltransferase [Thermodesulfobacteriota bacterium]